MAVSVPVERLAITPSALTATRKGFARGTWVVLRDLKGRPDLNGRLGIVLAGGIDMTGGAGVSGNDGGATTQQVTVHVSLRESTQPLQADLFTGGPTRTHTRQTHAVSSSYITPHHTFSHANCLQVLDWSRSLGSRGHPLAPESVRSLPKNLEPVDPALPAIIIAYHFQKLSDLRGQSPYHSREFAAEMFQVSKNKVLDISGSSPREVLMMGRLLAAAQPKFSNPKTSAAELLGGLSPKRWKLAILTPAEPPLSPEEVAKVKLKAASSGCRHCSATGVKLRLCLECKAVSYCSKECQVADWKSRHKRECKGLAPRSTEAPNAAQSLVREVTVDMVSSGDLDDFRCVVGCSCA